MNNNIINIRHTSGQINVTSASLAITNFVAKWSKVAECQLFALGNHSVRLHKIGGFTRVPARV
jgi:hypothetical protein